MIATVLINFSRCRAFLRKLIHGLVRAHRAGSHPRFDERAGLLLRSRSRRAVASRRPGPADQVVGADMLDERLQRAVAVTRGILELSADLTDRLAPPTHVARRQ